MNFLSYIYNVVLCAEAFVVCTTSLSTGNRPLLSQDINAVGLLTPTSTQRITIENSPLELLELASSSKVTPVIT